MINWMKKEDITWLPPLRNNEHGWLNIEGTICLITNWHYFDDFGQTVETVTARSPEGELTEFYSMDEGLSWHTELSDWDQ